MTHRKKTNPAAVEAKPCLSRDEYRASLATLSPEFCCAIAARSAIRVLPINFSAPPEGDLAELVLLNVLRCIALNIARALFPNTWEILRVLGHRAAAASHELSIRLLELDTKYRKLGLRMMSWECDLRAMEEALRVSDQLADLILEHHDSHATYDAVQAMADAIDAVEQGHVFRTSKQELYSAGSVGFERGRRARDRIWSANLNDAEVILGGGSITALMARPLWPDTLTSWCEGRPKRSIFPTSSQWRIWKKLLNRVKTNRAVSKRELFAYCCIPESIWSKGAKETNQHIEEILASKKDLSPPPDPSQAAIVNALASNIRAAHRSRKKRAASKKGMAK